MAIHSGTELRAPPPPSFDSDAFRTALAEVRQIADTRTAAHLEIARFWADGAGNIDPAGPLERDRGGSDPYVGLGGGSPRRE